MARNSTSGTGFLLILALAALGAIINSIAEYPKELLIIGAVLLGGWLLVKLISRLGAGTATSGSSTIPLRTDAGYRAKSTSGDEFWIPPGGIAEVAGRALGPMLYVGTGLGSIGGGEPEPALIDPTLRVDKHVQDCSVRRLNYWPSYSSASPDARAAYLYWLKTGRTAPDADIGYVFLFFYGLERRALHDARSSSVASAEIPRVVAEVTRLVSIYGGQRSFRRYASAFLDFVQAHPVPARSYTSAPAGEIGQALGASHRLALAQCAADRQPLPAPWAFFWITSHGAAALGTPARRCPAAFKQLFETYYREEYGDGLTLPLNRTRLKLEYTPATSSFRGAMDELVLELDLPDVSVLTSPVRKLETVALRAITDLERYSRFIGKNPEATQSFEALVELPVSLWPDEYRKPVQSLHEVVQRAGKPAAIPFEKFRSWLPAWSELTRPKLRSLSSALAKVGLGMEPDVRFGGAAPALDSRVVVFADDPRTATAEPSPRYLAAALTVQLAAAVITADGGVAEVERNLLARQLDNWLHLNESERRRLNALLRFLLASPPKLSGLKSRIEALDRAARESLGDFLAVVAQADDTVTPEEIKILQKIFKLLGLDPESVFSKVHIAATEPVTVQPAAPSAAGHRIPPPPQHPRPAGATGIRLDPARIAALQKDSERVAAILAGVFQDPEPVAAEEVPEVPDVEEPGLLGLDSTHAALLETLLARTHWNRVELEELASDRELMLDGALERMNDACFDRLNMALFEGADPLTLNIDVIRELQGGHHQES